MAERGHDEDHPAHFDQLRSETIDLIRGADSWVAFVFKDDEMHAIMGKQPGFRSADLLLNSMRGIQGIWEANVEMESEEESDHQT